MPKSPSIQTMRKLVSKWQQVLGLQDWKIKVVFGTPVEEDPDYDKYEMQLGAMAEITWFTEDAIALMLLNKDAEEHTIVHELLHLRLEGHKRIDGNYDPMYEQALNKIADALL